MWRWQIIRLIRDSGLGWGLKWHWYLIHVILPEDRKTAGDHWSVVSWVCQEVCPFQQLDGGSYGGPAGHVHSAYCWGGPGGYPFHSSVAGWLQQKARSTTFIIPESNCSSWAVQSYSTWSRFRKTGHIGNPQRGVENFPELWHQGQDRQPLQHHHNRGTSQQVGKGSFNPHMQTATKHAADDGCINHKMGMFMGCVHPLGEEASSSKR